MANKLKEYLDISLASMRPGPMELRSISEVWKSLVGPRLARVAQPLEWAPEDELLVIGVADEEWHDTLAGMKGPLRAKLRRFLGDEITEIKFTVRPDLKAFRERPSEETSRSPDPKLSEETSRDLEPSLDRLNSSLADKARRIAAYLEKRDNS